MAKRLIYLPDPTIKFYTRSTMYISTFSSVELERMFLNGKSLTDIQTGYFEIDLDNDDINIFNGGDRFTDRFSFIKERVDNGEYFPGLLNKIELFEVMDFPE